MQQVVGTAVHSAEDVSEYVAEALRICAAHDLEVPDRSRLLPTLVDLLAQRPVALAQPSPVAFELPHSLNAGMNPR